MVEAARIQVGHTFAVEFDTSEPDVLTVRRIRESYAGVLEGLYEPSNAYLERERAGWE